MVHPADRCETSTVACAGEATRTARSSCSATLFARRHPSLSLTFHCQCPIRNFPSEPFRGNLPRSPSSDASEPMLAVGRVENDHVFQLQHFIPVDRRNDRPFCRHQNLRGQMGRLVVERPKPSSVEDHGDENGPKLTPADIRDLDFSERAYLTG